MLTNGNVGISVDAKLYKRILLATELLYAKIKGVDLNQIGISEYNQRYMGQILANPESILQCYSYLLALALSSTRTPIEEFVLVDYGGGNGLLSLLAVESGVGRVIYNDIYDVSCNDIKKFTHATDIKIADFVCGDIDELISYIQKETITLNAVVSYDVIEHIYDIEGYLKKLRLLSNFPFRIVFASGANIKNPSYTRSVMKKQILCEYEDREWKWGHKERDTLRSYFDIRKEIIFNYEPKLVHAEVEKLAKMSRGLMKHDIEKYIDEYKERGDISYRPDHPTNTCDPYTGNWAEHLIEPDWFVSILKKENFKAKILSGFWETTGNFHRRNIRKFKNKIIKYFGRKALFLSPYYIVYADYEV